MSVRFVIPMCLALCAANGCSVAEKTVDSIQGDEKPAATEDAPLLFEPSTFGAEFGVPVHYQFLYGDHLFHYGDNVFDHRSAEDLWARIPCDDIRLARHGFMGGPWWVNFQNGGKALYGGKYHQKGTSGIEGPEQEGVGTIDEFNFGLICMLIERFELESATYSVNETDHELLELTVGIGDREIFISDYGRQGPPELFAVHAMIMQAIEEARWYPPGTTSTPEGLRSPTPNVTQTAAAAATEDARSTAEVISEIETAAAPRYWDGTIFTEEDARERGLLMFPAEATATNVIVRLVSYATLFRALGQGSSGDDWNPHDPTWLVVIMGEGITVGNSTSSASSMGPFLDLETSSEPIDGFFVAFDANSGNGMSYGSIVGTSGFMSQGIAEALENEAIPIVRATMIPFGP